MIKTSNDGSHTVVSEKFQVTYHSMYGAITESKVVFIDSGLEYLFQSKKNSISVFEMGFGTGLNAFMSALWASEKHANVSYTGIEAYPISEDNFKQLNFADFLGFKDLFLKYTKYHGIKNNFVAPFQFAKIETKLQDYKNEDMFDVIFMMLLVPEHSRNFGKLISWIKCLTSFLQVDCWSLIVLRDNSDAI